MLTSTTHGSLTYDETAEDLDSQELAGVDSLLKALIRRVEPTSDPREMREAMDTVELLGLYILLRSFYAGELAASPANTLG